MGLVGGDGNRSYLQRSCIATRFQGTDNYEGVSELYVNYV